MPLRRPALHLGGRARLFRRRRGKKCIIAVKVACSSLSMIRDHLLPNLMDGPRSILKLCRRRARQDYILSSRTTHSSRNSLAYAQRVVIIRGCVSLIPLQSILRKKLFITSDFGRYATIAVLFQYAEERATSIK